MANRQMKTEFVSNDQFKSQQHMTPEIKKQKQIQIQRQKQRQKQMQMQKQRIMNLQHRINARSRLIKIMVLIILFLLIVIAIQFFLIKNTNIVKAQSGSNVVIEEDEITPSEEQVIVQNNNMPLLVNLDNPMPKDFVPDIINLENQKQCERKTAEKYAKMKDDAFAAGINLWIASGYRSLERQTELFEERIKKYEKQGYSYEEAYKKTAEVIAVPGTSEHTLGYALDLNIVETSFEYSKEYDWLIDNCANYGFILRYPKDKVSITDISYEPWHYRYVGEKHAKIIMENEICLEEYLLDQY